jgi:hypothetical protein
MLKRKPVFLALLLSSSLPLLGQTYPEDVKSDFSNLCREKWTKRGELVLRQT